MTKNTIMLNDEQVVYLTQTLCDRANDLNEMMCYADSTELKEMQVSWEQELEEIQSILNVI